MSTKKLFQYLIKYNHTYKYLVEKYPRTFKEILNYMHWYKSPYAWCLNVEKIVKANLEEEYGKKFDELPDSAKEYFNKVKEGENVNILTIGWYPLIQQKIIAKIGVRGVDEKIVVTTVGYFTDPYIERLNILTFESFADIVNTNEVIELLKILIDIFENKKFKVLGNNVTDVIEYVKDNWNREFLIAHYYAERFIGGNVLVYDKSLRTWTTSKSIGSKFAFVIIE